MPADFSKLERTHIPTHHADYWTARRIAFRSVHMLERAIERTAEEPTYICREYDQNGDVVPVENTEPWEAVAIFGLMVARNPNAVSILNAQGRADLIFSVQSVNPENGCGGSGNLDDDASFDDGPRRYCNYQCQNCDRIQSREQPPKICTICGCDEFQPVN